jgi:hypothetical protein
VYLAASSELVWTFVRLANCKGAVLEELRVAEPVFEVIDSRPVLTEKPGALALPVASAR